MSASIFTLSWAAASRLKTFAWQPQSTKAFIGVSLYPL